MNLRAKLPPILLITALAGLSLWAFPIVKDRYFAPESAPAEKSAKPEGAAQPGNAEETSPEEDAGIIDEEISSEEDAATEDEEILPEDADAETLAEDSFLDILPSDCDKSCQEFTEPEDVEYCKNYCGLAAPRKDTSSCDQLEDLEADYCFKDTAIEKKDPKLCDEILDASLKKACRNRILEDIVDEQR